MRKQKWVINIACIIILFVWGYFCYTEIPQMQQKQRDKEEKKVVEVLKMKQAVEFLKTKQAVESITDSSEIFVQVNDTDIVKEAIVSDYQEDTEVIEEKSYTDEELQLMARLIESEGGITNYQCKLYIGSVVLNRVASDKYPDTIEEVIFDRKPCVQFSVIIKNDNGDRPIDCTPSEDSLKAAEEVLTNGTLLPEEVLVFYADYVSGNWVNTRETYTQEDCIIFAYD